MKNNFKRLLSLLVSSVLTLTAFTFSLQSASAINSPPYTYFPSPPPDAYDNGYSPQVAEILDKLVSFAPTQKYAIVLVAYDTTSNKYFGVAIPTVSSCLAYNSFGNTPYGGGLLDVITFPFLQCQFPSSIGAFAWYNPDFQGGKWVNSRPLDTTFFINKDYFIFRNATNINYFMFPFADSSSSTTFPNTSSTARRYILGPACYCAVDTNYFSLQFNINDPDPYFPVSGIPSTLNYFGVDELPLEITPEPETTTILTTTVPQPTQQTLPADWFEDSTVESSEDIDLGGLPSISDVGNSLSYLKQSISDVFTNFSSGLQFWLHSFDEFTIRFDFLKVLIMACLALMLVQYIFWRL